MFDQLLKRLLQGEFICEVSDEAGFRYLQDPDNAGQVDAFLTRLDYRLSSTQNRLAFYAGYRTIDSGARSDIRKDLSAISRGIKPSRGMAGYDDVLFKSGHGLVTGRYAELFQFVASHRTKSGLGGSVTNICNIQGLYQ